METRMAETHAHDRPARSIIHLLAAGALYVAVGGAILMGAWNRVGHDLLGGPGVTYVDGVASLAALVVLTAPLRLRGSSHRGSREHGSRRHDVA
jgi:hypothetical protein